MFDPYRLSPSRENFYYQRKGQVLRIRDRMPPPQPNYTKEDLKPLVPYFLQNRLAKRYSPKYHFEDIQIKYLRYTQPQTGINFPSSVFDHSEVPPPEQLPEDFNISEITLRSLTGENVCYMLLFSDPDGNPGKLKLKVVITQWTTKFSELDLGPDADPGSFEDMVEPFQTVEGVPIEVDTSDGYSEIKIISVSNLLPNDLFRIGKPIIANFFESLYLPRLTVPITFSEGPSLLQFIDEQKQKFQCQCYVSDTIEINYDTIIYEFK